ncbi:ankyrin repeat domain-containing protein [Thiotrichales bacterium 19S9-12]|nr:ankyrin repeat domain-containing protein [Thiotrichales bacterium 19S9-11]MCF6812576.1 ankyrin repeat domain-containing protein [Thiotrichales bacterium 19S9-12]
MPKEKNDDNEYKNGLELLILIVRGNLEGVKKLFFEVKGDFQYQNGKTPLTYAIEYGKPEIVEFLLHNGAMYTQEARDAIEKCTINKDQIIAVVNNCALLFDVIKGNLDHIQNLLKSNANVNYKDSNDTTILHYAASYGYFSVVKELCDRGAKINAIDNFEKTPLEYAVEKNQVAVVELLLERGAHIVLKIIEAAKKNNEILAILQNHIRQYYLGEYGLKRKVQPYFYHMEKTSLNYQLENDAFEL